MGLQIATPLFKRSQDLDCVDGVCRASSILLRSSPTDGRRLLATHGRGTRRVRLAALEKPTARNSIDSAHSAAHKGRDRQHKTGDGFAALAFSRRWSKAVSCCRWRVQSGMAKRNSVPYPPTTASNFRIGINIGRRDRSRSTTCFGDGREHRGANSKQIARRRAAFCLFRGCVPADTWQAPKFPIADGRQKQRLKNISKPHQSLIVIEPFRWQRPSMRQGRQRNRETAMVGAGNGGSGDNGRGRPWRSHGSLCTGERTPMFSQSAEPSKARSRSARMPIVAGAALRNQNPRATTARTYFRRRRKTEEVIDCPRVRFKYVARDRAQMPCLRFKKRLRPTHEEITSEARAQTIWSREA